mmetsp:Transcript_42796/g.114533  ORF Transcript_42796/g.114533 Transcript_42796/m.114533 type:complete len:119 (+) Transcript_42796:343-699(+)
MQMERRADVLIRSHPSRLPELRKNSIQRTKSSISAEAQARGIVLECCGGPLVMVLLAYALTPSSEKQHRWQVERAAGSRAVSRGGRQKWKSAGDGNPLHAVGIWGLILSGGSVAARAL